MNGGKIMKVKMNNKIISFEINNTEYNVIDEDGQMDLKEIYKFVKENYSNKDEVIKSIEFDEQIEKEVRNGLDFFIVELFNKFKDSDFKLE